jgi:hypothetical protein
VEFQSKPIGWALWLQWVAASTAGFAVAATAFGALGTWLTDITPAFLRALTYCGTFGVGASLPGFLHWLILRRWFARAGWWILASGVGSILGFVVLGWGVAVGDTGGGIVREWIVPNLAFSAAGAVVGTMQWLVLRRWVSCSGWWVLASIVSWVGATYVYASLTRANDVYLPLGGAAAGIVSGAIMGLVLLWLMRHTQQKGMWKR